MGAPPSASRSLPPHDPADAGATDTVLVVIDDDADERRLAELAVARMADPPTLVTFARSDDALDFLRSSTGHRCVVLVDLHMAGVDGRDVVRLARADPDLAAVPMIVFSSSGHENDVVSAYDAGANAYLVKPDNVDLIARALTAVCQFFFGTRGIKRRDR